MTIYTKAIAIAFSFIFCSRKSVSHLTAHCVRTAVFWVSEWVSERVLTIGYSKYTKYQVKPHVHQTSPLNSIFYFLFSFVTKDATPSSTKLNHMQLHKSTLVRDQLKPHTANEWWRKLYTLYTYRHINVRCTYAHLYGSLAIRFRQCCRLAWLGARARTHTSMCSAFS